MFCDFEEPATVVNILQRNENQEVKSLSELLTTWAIEENIQQTSFSRLLKIIKPYLQDEILHSDARTLLKTPRTTQLKIIEPGYYYHFGLNSGVINFLNQHDHFVSTSTKIEIMINIDGLPISKSSNNQLWPILGSVFKYNHVFMIGLYHGKSKKPNNANEFSSDFVNETKELVINSVKYNGKTFSFSIKGFSVDVLAKSYMLSVKGHGGYNSCTKCDIGRRLLQAEPNLFSWTKFSIENRPRLYHSQR